MEKKTEANETELTVQQNIAPMETIQPLPSQSPAFIIMNKKIIIPENVLQVNREGKGQKRRKSAPDHGNSETHVVVQGGKRIHGTNSLDDRETFLGHKRIKEEWHIGQPTEMSREGLKLVKRDISIMKPLIDKTAVMPGLQNIYTLNPQMPNTSYVSSQLPSPIKLPASCTITKVVPSPHKSLPPHRESPKKEKYVQLFHQETPKKEKTVQSSRREFPLDNLLELKCPISEMVGTAVWKDYKTNLKKNKRKRKVAYKFTYISETGNLQRLRWRSFKGDTMEVNCPLKFNFVIKEKFTKPKKCLWSAKCILCNEDEVGPRTLNITRKSTYFSEYGLETSTDKLGYMSANTPAGVTAHLNCLIYSSAPGMMQDFVKMAKAPEHFIDGFPIEEVTVQVNLAEKSKCSYCGKRGAVSQCSKKSCTQTGWYHFPCGLRNGSWQDGKGRTYCSRHIPYQIEKRTSGNKLKLRRPRKTMCCSQETPPSSQESVTMSESTRDYFSSRSAEDARIQKMATKGNTVIHIGPNFKEELDNEFNRLTPINALDILYQMEIDNVMSTPASLDNTLAGMDNEPASLYGNAAGVDDRLSTVVRREYGGKKFIFKTREFGTSPTEGECIASSSKQSDQTNPPVDDSVANNEMLTEPVKMISTSLLLMKHCLNEVIDDSPPCSPPSSPLALLDNNEPVSSPRSKSSDFAAFHNDIVDINLVSNNEVMESQNVPPTCRIIHPAFPENIEITNDLMDDTSQVAPEDNQMAGHMQCTMENDNLKAEIQQLKGLLMKKEQKIEAMKKENNRLIEENQRKENGWQKQLLSHMQENRNLREQLKTARVENVDLKEQREMKKRAIQHFADQLRNGLNGLEDINCSNSANLDSNADREPISNEIGIKLELAD